MSLRAPGPDDEEVLSLLRLAARVPDHGKLAPWRFIVLRDADKVPLLAALTPLAAHQPHPDKALAALGKLQTPPVSILVVAVRKPGAIPAWEQELSAGAVCMSLLIAAAAAGYGANWITDWYSYDDAAKRLFGLGPEEAVAGFIHLGTPDAEPLERVRPEIARLTAGPGA